MSITRAELQKKVTYLVALDVGFDRHTLKGVFFDELDMWIDDRLR